MMKINNIEYATSYEDDFEAGCGSAVLHSRSGSEKDWSVAAKATYWDAVGRYYVSIIAPDVPWVVLEALMKKAIKKEGISDSPVDSELLDLSDYPISHE